MRNKAEKLDPEQPTHLDVSNHHQLVLHLHGQPPSVRSLPAQRKDMSCLWDI